MREKDTYLHPDCAISALLKAAAPVLVQFTASLSTTEQAELSQLQERDTKS